MAELNELFEQILHSERNFKERTSRLRECKLDIKPHTRESTL